VPKRRVVLALSFALVGLFVSSSVLMAAGLPRVVNGKHVMWGRGQGYPAAEQASANNLIYHGGPVETAPAVFIVYWGTQWQDGFTISHGASSSTSATIQNYVNTFFNTMGGSPWAGVQTQYCQGASVGFACTGQVGAAIITNPTGQLHGVWTDPSPVPSNMTPQPAKTATNAPGLHCRTLTWRARHSPSSRCGVMRRMQARAPAQ
jgi:hypothetical protein